MTGLEVAKLSFDTKDELLATFSIKWRIRGEDGMVPPQGLGFIKLARTADNTYAWSRWEPGQVESEVKGIAEL